MLLPSRFSIVATLFALLTLALPFIALAESDESDSFTPGPINPTFFTK